MKRVWTNSLRPKPLLIIASDRELLWHLLANHLEWHRGIRQLKRVYETLGHSERIAWFGTPLPHGLAHDMRLQIYSWFGRGLKGDTSVVRQAPLTRPEPDEQLFVRESGSLVQTLHSETPFSLNRKRVVARTPVPLEQLLGLERPPQVPAATLSRASFARTRIEALQFASASDVWIPASVLPGARCKVIESDPHNTRAEWPVFLARRRTLRYVGL